MTETFGYQRFSRTFLVSAAGTRFARRTGVYMAASSPGSGLGTQPQGTLARTRHAGGIDDTFFRHIVSGMRNGVLAITSDGRLALINDEAYRVFGIEPQAADLGQPIASVLKAHPDVVR